MSRPYAAGLMIWWVSAALAAVAVDLELPTANDALWRPGGDAAYFQPTVEGTVESGMFGCVRRDGRRFHEGIDIRCGQWDARGEPVDSVRAVADGRVAFVNLQPGLSNYGRYLVLEHVWDGVSVHTLYAHLAAVTDGVAAGAVVRRGQTIARLGHSTNTREGIPAERAHLHFEVSFLMNPQFARWFVPREPKAPPFGAYNGRNLIGLDPAAWLRAWHDRPTLNFAAYLAAQPIGLTLLTREAPAWVGRHPHQVQAGRAGGGPVVAWEIGATALGLPVVVWPRTTGELTSAQHQGLARASFLLARVNAAELAATNCRRLVEPRAGGAGWQFTDAGREWAELLTYRP